MPGFAANSRYVYGLSDVKEHFILSFYEQQGIEDIESDQTFGFELVTTDDIDDIGVSEIIERIRSRIGDSPVYLRCALLGCFLGLKSLSVGR